MSTAHFDDRPESEPERPISSQSAFGGDVSEQGDGNCDFEVPALDEPSARPARKPSSILEAMVLVLLALVLALSLKSYVAEAYEIKGKSMEPTFHNGERVVVLKLLYDVQRGDIIIFSSEEDASKDLIKRVIGLPGDRVQIIRGRVFVNGEELQEAYLEPADRSSSGDDQSYVVPPGHYYVLGDNRRDSHDSRRFPHAGVPAGNVKGEVWVRWWPFDEFRSF